MRYVMMALLILLLAVLIAFAVVNRAVIQVRFPFIDVSLQAPTFLVMIVFYVLGMVSGWWALDTTRHMLRSVSERKQR